MSKIFVFDSLSEKFKKPFGAIREGEWLRLSAKALRHEVKKAAVLFISGYTGKEFSLALEWTFSDGVYDVLSAETDAFSEPDIIRYCFLVETFDGRVRFYGKNGLSDSKEGVIFFQLTVCSKDYDTPDWFSEGVTYQIFVDRFCQSHAYDAQTEEYFRVHKDKNETPEFLPNEKGVVENRDIFGGNLAGVIEQLPHLENLGVRTIYLNPIFEAWSNHKYNTADYKKIDSSFGNEDVLKKLCKEAAKRNIRIILDGVFSHTGSDSVYFNKEGRYGADSGAYRNVDSPYREWYGIDENNRYSSWWGIDTLPQVNELNSSYLEFVTGENDSVISHWMRCGVSGWRLDVADELPDEFISKLKNRARLENKEAIVIGEVWEDASTKQAYGVNKKYFTEGVLDGVMNYPLRHAIIGFLTKTISAEAFSDAILSLIENYPKPALSCLMNIIGTHDTVRAINELSVGSMSHMSKQERAELTLGKDEYALGKRRLFLAATIQFIFPGSPCIYYGDEIGMEGFEDPFNRRFYTWDDMDAEILAFYRELGKIKTSEHSLQDETRLEVEFAKRDVAVLSRGKIVAIINRGASCRIFETPKNFQIILSSEKVLKNGKKILIGAESSCILKCK